jgi:SAM-dependent MidA family methyltransferase
VSDQQPDSLSVALAERVAAAIAAQGGWLSFDRFMSMALYEPGLGYYARGAQLFGSLPSSGSDFVTAPELSPLFGATLARQVAQALEATDTAEVIEFGAGSGALAAQLLRALGSRLRHYSIVELSGALRARQAEALAPWAGQVRWLDALPDAMQAVVVGNEVLDAMPVQLLAFDGQRWSERGVVLAGGGLAWADRPTALRPPPVDAAFAAGTVTEIHPQAEAFIRTLAARLQRGAAFFIDYGFPDREYYHPQRSGGTLMCHRGHRAEAAADSPLRDLGSKDISAHVDFSAIALAGQDAGLHVLGYTSQARFLLNCGFGDGLQGTDLRGLANAQRLIMEHEMGELFKVIGFAGGPPFDAIGFTQGDRSHTL